MITLNYKNLPDKKFFFDILEKAVDVADVAVVKYEDGNEIEMLLEEVAIEFIINRAMKVAFPEMKITSKYNIRNFYNEGEFTEGCPTKLISVSGKDIIDYNLERDILDFTDALKEFKKMAYEALALIYKEIGIKSKEYEFTLSYKDMMEIHNDKEVRRVIDEFEQTHDKNLVKEIYATLADSINKGYDGNMVKRAVQAKAVNWAQYSQSTTVRGFTNRADSTLNPYPITTSYTEGLYNLPDLLQDSSGATIALLFSNTGISKSEASSKRIQAVASFVEKLHIGDCQTYRYTEHTVDLNMRKCYNFQFKRKPDEEWQWITDDTELVDKETILVRDPTCCLRRNTKEVCVKCMGKMSYNMEPRFNLGMFMSSLLTNPKNQRVLSVKHFILSAINTAMKLRDVAAKYLKMRGQTTISFVAKEFKDYGKQVIILPHKSVRNLLDISTKALKDADIEKLTSVESLTLKLFKYKKDTKPDVVEHMFTSELNKTASLTREAAIYAKKNMKFVNGEWHLDITNWKKSSPFFYIPPISFDSQAFNDSVDSMIKNHSEHGVKITNSKEFINKLFRLINTQLEIDYNIIALLVYSLTAVDKEAGDYRLGRFVENPDIISIADAMQKRNITTCAYEGKIYNMVGNKYVNVSHPLDGLLIPDILYGGTNDKAT